MEGCNETAENAEGEGAGVTVEVVRRYAVTSGEVRFELDGDRLLVNGEAIVRLRRRGALELAAMLQRYATDEVVLCSRGGAAYPQMAQMGADGGPPRPVVLDEVPGPGRRFTEESKRAAAAMRQGGAAMELVRRGPAGSGWECVDGVRRLPSEPSVREWVLRYAAESEEDPPSPSASAGRGRRGGIAEGICGPIVEEEGVSDDGPSLEDLGLTLNDLGIEADPPSPEATADRPACAGGYGGQGGGLPELVWILGWDEVAMEAVNALRAAGVAVTLWLPGDGAAYRALARTWHRKSIGVNYNTRLVRPSASDAGVPALLVRSSKIGFPASASRIGVEELAALLGERGRELRDAWERNGMR